MGRGWGRHSAWDTREAGLRGAPVSDFHLPRLARRLTSRCARCFFLLLLRSMDEIRRMYRLGYEYARRLHADGRFDHYELSELLLQVRACGGT